MQLKHILSDYFDGPQETPKRSVLTENILTESLQPNFPVTPHVCSWEIHTSPERFTKTYTFSDRRRLFDFVRDLLVFEDDFGHHGTHKIDHNEVTVEVYTHDINRITELDQEYTKNADMIFQDVLDYGY